MATGRTVRLTTGIATTSDVGDQLVTQSLDALISQSGDFLVTQSSGGAVSVHAMTVAVDPANKSVDLLAGLVATSTQGQPLVTQAGDTIATQAGDSLILQLSVAATGASILVPSVTVTGS